jgi:hypothetical protein
MVDLICRGVLVGLPPTNQHFENVQILSIYLFIILKCGPTLPANFGSSISNTAPYGGSSLPPSVRPHHCRQLKPVSLPFIYYYYCTVPPSSLLLFITTAKFLAIFNFLRFSSSSIVISISNC